MKTRIKQKICIMGLGYIGLPTAALLANRGHDVVGVDINQTVVDTINRGEIHIVEPDLDSFVRAAVYSKNLKASTKPCEADIFYICVPTPFFSSDSDTPIPNLDFVKSATKSIAPFIKTDNIVILESTSPVGTTDIVQQTLAQSGVDTDKIYIAHCPERVLPGRVMVELIQNDRIIGGLTKKATKKVADFYKEFVAGKILETDAKTAEMAKLTENSFRDVNIAFANELSMICDKNGIDVNELISLANRHPRVNILQPGAGVGGHCIAVDPWFIVSQAKGDAKIIRTAREVNDYKSIWVIEKIKNAALEYEKQNSKTPTIAIMGLAFKPNIDDLRESAAVKIALNLKESSLQTIFVEPNIKSHEKLEIITISDALEKADIIAYLVAHKEFSDIDDAGKVVVDFCGVRGNSKNRFYF